MMQPEQQQDGMVAPQPSSMAAQPPIDQQHYNQQSQQQQQLMMEQQQQQQQLSEQQYQQQQPQQQQSPPNSDEVRTIWIGDLQHWMDEDYISSCFAHTGELVNSKIIRNKRTSQSKCYGFIEFSSHAAAERILQTYNNTLMPYVEQNYKLNWDFNGFGEKRGEEGSDYTIFVGGLASNVTDYTLQETFKDRYSSVKGAIVKMDKLPGRNKRYGFVRFRDENEQICAMSEMNGAMCLGRAMRIEAAVNKKSVGGAASYKNTQEILNDSDPNNTIIFVGNLDSNVTEEDLGQKFHLYGEVVLVKILVSKNCGFVKFTNRSSAEEALKALNGVQLGGRNLRLYWGHSRNNRQSRPNLNQWDNTAYYAYPQGYNSYGDVSALQDPNMYCGGYLGYASYKNTQEILNDSDPNNTTIFVGNLDSNVTEEDLGQKFHLYGEVVLVKILVSKNCGFVKFTNRSSAEEALKALNGVQLGGRNLRLSWGHSRNNRQSRPNLNQWDNAAYYAYPQGYNSYGDVSALQDPNMYCGGYLGYASYKNTQEILNDSDPNNTTIFVGNLDSNVTEEDLGQKFRLYGEVVLVKILVSKNCGFVKFTNRSSAEEALMALNGVQLGGRNLRLSWGHGRNNRQSRSNLNQWDNAAYYGYPQGYNSYGDVSAFQDPNMYYGGYLGYGGYAMP